MEEFEREEKQKRRKTMALAALPFSLVFCIWRLQMNPKAAPPPAAPAAVKASTAKGSTPAVAGLVKRLHVASFTKDPFVPLVEFETRDRLQRAADAMAASRPPVRITEVLKGGLPMPGMGMAELAPFPAPDVQQPRATLPEVRPAPLPGTRDPASPEPEKPAMPYTLTGVVKGNPDIAILRHADGSRRIARTGDMLDGSFRVVAIGEDTVTVQGDGERHQLRIGVEPAGAATPTNVKKEAVALAS